MIEKRNSLDRLKGIGYLIGARDDEYAVIGGVIDSMFYGNRTSSSRLIRSHITRCFHDPAFILQEFNVLQFVSRIELHSVAETSSNFSFFKRSRDDSCLAKPVRIECVQNYRSEFFFDVHEMKFVYVRWNGNYAIIGIFSSTNVRQYCDVIVTQVVLLDKWGSELNTFARFAPLQGNVGV